MLAPHKPAFDFCTCHSLVLALFSFLLSGHVSSDQFPLLPAHSHPKSTLLHLSSSPSASLLPSPFSYFNPVILSDVLLRPCVKCTLKMLRVGSLYWYHCQIKGVEISLPHAASCSYLGQILLTGSRIRVRICIHMLPGLCTVTCFFM